VKERAVLQLDAEWTATAIVLAQRARKRVAGAGKRRRLRGGENDHPQKDDPTSPPARQALLRLL